jgi:two-component system NarL family response regulator
MTIRVLIADDHAVVRAGLTAMIANAADIVIVGVAVDGEEAVALYAEHRPDVVLMDIRMPRLDGVGATHAIRAADPDARIVVLTMYERDTDIHRALTAGASAYLLEGARADDLMTAIRRVASGKRVIPAEVADRPVEYTPHIELTPREIEVLRLVAKGLRNKEVARVIGRTEGTVKVHLKNVLQKLGVTDRTEAVTIALQRASSIATTDGRSLQSLPGRRGDWLASVVNYPAGSCSASDASTLSGDAMTTVAINGLGRTGRAFLKLAVSRPDLDVVAVNDLGDPRLPDASRFRLRPVR